MSRELIDQLDPHRSYGARSYDEVVEDVRQGLLRLEPGRSSIPVIRDMSTGLPVKGGGQPAIPEGTDLTRWGRSHFIERAAQDCDAVYEAIVESATRGDPRAQKLFIETFLGRPQEGLRDDGATKVLLALLTARGPSRIEYIDAETGEPRS